MLKKMLLGTALAGCLAMTPAHAVLQVAISDGTNIFTCFDGQGCDFSGPTNRLLTLNTTVGNFNVAGTLSEVVQGSGNLLDFSTLTITNNGLTAGNLVFVVSATDFTGPVSTISESASLTFRNNLGATASSLSFYADHNNGQGAGAGLVTPGNLLFTTSGVPFANPSSFSGTNNSVFLDPDLFSMTEYANLRLLAGSSVTGFDMSMATQGTLSAVPEPATWAMMLLGFAGVGAVAMRKRRHGTPLRLA